MAQGGLAIRVELLMRPGTFLLAFALSVASASAYADATRDALAEMAKCADIADGAMRLKCFDDATPRAKSALAAPAAPPEAPSKSFLEWFGFSRPPAPVTKPEEFGKPPPQPAGELNEITSNVIEFAKTARGKAVFILENGQVWRQLDGDGTVVLDPPAGKTMKVTVERGFLDSYNLTIDGRNGLIKVTRLK
jgi:hypothetical protein